MRSAFEYQSKDGDVDGVGRGAYRGAMRGAVTINERNRTRSSASQKPCLLATKSSPPLEGGGLRKLTNGTEIKVRLLKINGLDRDLREISLIVRFHESSPNSTNERPALKIYAE